MHRNPHPCFAGPWHFCRPALSRLQVSHKTSHRCRTKLVTCCQDRSSLYGIELGSQNLMKKWMDHRKITADETSESEYRGESGENYQILEIASFCGKLRLFCGKLRYDCGTLFPSELLRICPNSDLSDQIGLIWCP